MTFPTTTPELPLVHRDRTWIVECWKCQGKGSVSWGQNDTGVVYIGQERVEVPKVCYECHGLGFGTDTLNRETRRAKDRARREAKAEAKWAAGQAQRDADAAAEVVKRSAWAAAHADVVEGLALVTGEFGEDLRIRFAADGELNDRACEIVRQRAAEAAAATPVPTGRMVVTGELVGTKRVEGWQGRGETKLIVRDDRGFKVFGSYPASLCVEVGDRITFTATLQPSNDDPTFGFYSRPTKAEYLSSPAAATA